MKRLLVTGLVLAMSVGITQSQAQPPISTLSTISKPIYTTEDDEISRAINDLSAIAKSKAYDPEKEAASLKAAQAKAKAEADALALALALKPNVKIGMTAKQVINGSKWGAPLYKRTTINATGKFETWVYVGNAWLSLRGGKVTSINY